VVELCYKLCCLFSRFRFVLQEVDKLEARMVIDQHQQPPELLPCGAAKRAGYVGVDKSAGV
jgi:hypothetical protein